MFELSGSDKTIRRKRGPVQSYLPTGAGKIVGLLGPNGSGKTTLMKLINALLQPTDGCVLIDGKIPGVDTKKIVAYLPDHMYLSDWMRVRTLLNISMIFMRISTGTGRKKC